jgi:hypothetical protein
LKSANIAGVDVLQAGLDLTSGAPHGNLAIVVSAAAGYVDGTVTDSDDQPLAGAMVILVPEFSHRKESRLYKQTTTDQYGAFKLRGIAPGGYKLFAWDGTQDVAYQDSEFLKGIDGQGTEVHIDENAGAALKLKAISITNTR